MDEFEEIYEKKTLRIKKTDKVRFKDTRIGPRCGRDSVGLGGLKRGEKGRGEFMRWPECQMGQAGRHAQESGSGFSCGVGVTF